MFFWKQEEENQIFQACPSVAGSKVLIRKYWLGRMAGNLHSAEGKTPDNKEQCNW